MANTSTVSAINRQNNALRALPAFSQFPIHITPRNDQVKRMISGAPVSICIVPASAAVARARPPLRQPVSAAPTTHGIQPSAAMLFGHISAFRARPLNANAMPATAAPVRLPVQRKASQYIPTPASH